MHAIGVGTAAVCGTGASVKASARRDSGHGLEDAIRADVKCHCKEPS